MASGADRPDQALLKSFQLDQVDLIEELLRSNEYIINESLVGYTGFVYVTLAGLAAKCNAAKIMETLIVAGADVNQFSLTLRGHVFGDGQLEAAPLYFACKNKNMGMVRMLTDAGADVNAVVTETYGPPPKGTSDGSPAPVCKETLRRTLAHMFYWRTDLIQHLVSCGADMTLCDGKGEIALMSACECLFLSGGGAHQHLRSIAQLLQASPPPPPPTGPYARPAPGTGQGADKPPSRHRVAQHVVLVSFLEDYFCMQYALGVGGVSVVQGMVAAGYVSREVARDARELWSKLLSHESDWQCPFGKGRVAPHLIPHLIAWMDGVAEEPPSLKELCRLTIRKNVGPIRLGARLLELESHVPMALCKYLLLEDCLKSVV